jgi:hypothetical protein
MNEHMSPTPDDIDALFEWHATSDFAERVAKLDQESGARLLTSRPLKPLTEALTLRDFAVTLGFSQCRLCRSEFPDGELKYPGGKEIQIEITEVMTPGRKRDSEYKEFSERPTQNALSHHEWEDIRKAGSSWLDWMLTGIKKKLKYDKKIKYDIVVYNNIDYLFEMPEIGGLSDAVGALLNERGFTDHWVWQCRSTTIDLLWPRVLRLKIPGWQDRF